MLEQKADVLGDGMIAKIELSQVKALVTVTSLAMCPGTKQTLRLVESHRMPRYPERHCYIQ